MCCHVGVEGFFDLAASLGPVSKASHEALSVMCGSQAQIERLSKVRCTSGMQRTFEGACSGCKGPGGFCLFQETV